MDTTEDCGKKMVKDKQPFDMEVEEAQHDWRTVERTLLTERKKKQNCSKRMPWILVLILMVLLVIITAVAAVSLSKSQSSSSQSSLNQSSPSRSLNQSSKSQSYPSRSSLSRSSPGQTSPSQASPSQSSPKRSSPSQASKNQSPPSQSSLSRSSLSRSSPDQTSPSQASPSQSSPSRSSPRRLPPSQSSLSRSSLSRSSPGRTSPSQSSPSRSSLSRSSPDPSLSSPSRSSLSRSSPDPSLSSPRQSFSSQPSPSQASAINTSPRQSSLRQSSNRLSSPDGSQSPTSQPQQGLITGPYGNVVETFTCYYQDNNQLFHNFSNPTLSSEDDNLSQQVSQFLTQVQQPVQIIQEKGIPYCDQIEPTRLPVVGILETDITASGSSADVDVTIPLSTPRGTGGHHPDLALKYSSNGANSVLGLGWGMAFLPTISRCPKTITSNGYVQGITLTDQDAFCVGRDQLMLVQGQSPDAMNYRGERYKTARDSKILYKAYGPRNGLGPTYWTAHLPNGIRRVFGRSKDSTVLAPSGAVIVWQASSQTDPFGNVINMSYEQSTDGSADWYRKDIVYAEGNAKIEFTYSPRPDPVESYMHGVPVTTRKLLTSIRTYSAMPEETELFPTQPTHQTSFMNSSARGLLPIFTYHFSYEPSLVSGRSLLSRVQLCDGCDGACQPPLIFSYDKGSQESPFSNTLKETEISLPWAYYSSCISDQSGFGEQAYLHFTKKLTADVNGDGRQDIIVASWNANGFEVQTLFSTDDDGFQPADVPHFVMIKAFPRTTLDIFHHGKLSVFVRDFSGDGVPDITTIWMFDGSKGYDIPVSLAGKKFYVAVVTAHGLGNGSYSMVQYSFVDTSKVLGSYELPLCSHELVDVNSDFELDLLVICGISDGWRVMVALGNGTGLFQSGENRVSTIGKVMGLHTGIQLLVQDVTGDGSPDIVGVYAGPKGIFAYLSRSKANGQYESLVQQVLYSQDVGTVGNHSIELANLGGNTVDLVVSHLDNNGWTVWIARGTGEGTFRAAVPHALSTHAFGFGDSRARQLIQDMNGDGRADLVAIHLPDVHQGHFSVYIAYSLVGETHFSAVENITLSNSPGTAGSNHKTELIAADVTGDGRIDIGTYRFCPSCHSSACKVKLSVVPSQGRSPVDKLTRVENGFGSWSAIRYELMTNFSVYNKTPAYGLPVPSGPYISTSLRPKYFLQSLDHDDGLGGTSSISHFYAGYATQTRGYGSLGFAQITSQHSVTGIKQATDFSQDYVNRVLNLPVRIRTFSSAGIMLSDLHNTWNVVNIQPKQRKSDAIMSYTVIRQSQISNSEKGQFIKKEVTEAAFDRYGNAISTNYSATDAYCILQRKASTVYRNDESRWLIGLPEKVQQESAISWIYSPPDLLPPDLPAGQFRADPSGTRQWLVSSRKARRTFDTTKGYITSETLFAGTKYEVTTKSTRDSRGNVIRIESLAGGESSPQVVHMEYEPSGRFQVKSCDVINFCRYWSHGAIGQVIREATDSGDVIIHQYDSFMREQQVISSHGQSVNTSLLFCTGQQASQYNGVSVVETVSCSAFPNAVYAKVIQPLTGRPSYQYFDKLGRRLGSTGQLMDENTRITEETRYDKYGNPVSMSLPHKDTESVVTVSYGKDEFGRTVHVSNDLFPNRKVQILYSGGNVTFINPLKKQHKRVKNAQDLVYEVQNEKQQILRYWYDPDGNLIGVQGPINNGNAGWLMKALYDEGGYIKTLMHPDKGQYQYGHDSRGNLVWQANANGNNVTFERDERGRTTAMHTNEGSHYYEYSKKFPEHIVTEYSKGNSLDYRFNYAYDRRGLLVKVEKRFQLSQIDPLSQSNTGGCSYNYVLQYDYDAAARLTRIVYPSGFFITLQYDVNNRVTEVVDMMGNVHWRALEFNSNGQVTKEQRGNGLKTKYRYDSLSSKLLGILTEHSSGIQPLQNLSYILDAAENVIEREDTSKELKEQFTYDEMNRLVSASVQGAGSTFSQQFRYDANSNLVDKSDVGKFDFSSDHPHAVKEVRDPNDISQLKYDFKYDRNGNRVSGNGTSVIYNSMNKPVNISRGPFTTLFDYTLTGKLLVRRDLVWLYIPQNGGSSNISSDRISRANLTHHTYRTTVYVDDQYHEETTRDPVLKQSTMQKHYVQTYAVVVRVINGTDSSQGGVTEMPGRYDELKVIYPYRDIEDSVTLVTDQYGRKMQEFSYDICGSPRSPTTWKPLKYRDISVQSAAYLLLDEAENVLSKYQHTDQQGYGGHQQLFDIGGDYVHMGGRLYDSVHCTFVTPDPTTDDQYSLVSYNSYAYGHFNPLSGSDPSGYSFLSSISKFAKHIFEPVLHFVEHIVDDIAGVLRKIPLLNDILSIVVDIVADATGQYWIEFAWNIIQDRVRGESWSDVFIDSLVNLATYELGCVADASSDVEKLVIDAGKGAMKAFAERGNSFEKMVMGTVSHVDKLISGLIDKGGSNYFVLAVNNIPYFSLGHKQLATKAIESTIDNAAKDAMNGDFGDILKDSLGSAWKALKSDFVAQFDKHLKSIEHKVLNSATKWLEKVPLVNKLEKDYDRVKKFFGGSKKPQYQLQVADARSKPDEVTGSMRGIYFVLEFNSHAQIIYFGKTSSTKFFYSSLPPNIIIEIPVFAKTHKV